MLPNSKKNPILSVDEIKDSFPAGSATKEELANYYGLTNFDCAIPQQLFNILENEDFHPWGHFVYDYSDHNGYNNNQGTLFPLTKEGVSRYKDVFEYDFEDPRFATAI